MSAQENKITIILIAVVVLFMVCQTPNAVYLFYVSWFTQPTEQLYINLTLGKLIFSVVIKALELEVYILRN